MEQHATSEPQLRRWSSYASLTVAVLLVIAKASAWFVTDSLSLLASLVDAVVDVTAALVTVLGVHYAARPADAMHRFGHGKAESLAALIQALLLAGAASVLIFDGLHRLITPQAVAQLNVGLGVIAGSTLLTTVLVLFESHVTKRTRSHAIAADRSHHSRQRLRAELEHRRRGQHPTSAPRKHGRQPDDVLHLMPPRNFACRILPRTFLVRLRH